MEATDSYTVQFDGIALAPDALIGRPGDYYAEPTFTSGGMRFSAVQLGAAQALFNATVDFLRGQGRGNDPFQLQRLGQLAVLMESADQWLARASEWLEESFADASSIAAQAHMMRIATEQICTRVMELVEVSVGARGLTMPEPFARTIRDLQMYLRQGGFDHAFQVAGQYAIEKCTHG
jgi:alkylation response protein AidB-like acyl-CoA dehydrogenase